jgi:hypothetical protein
MLDEEGLSTISLTTIASITRRIKPSHALLVEHPFGLVMGDVNDRERQTAVLREMLAAAESAVPPGTIEALPLEWTKDDLRARQLRKEAH